ncbi:MAG: 5'-methylthioadenosine/S-adenosylhomocysteine nucleosidase [Candidatus Zixiibacteriota bacterium]|nr:MAG: 5'-methylthioadenosine/S-adenosylhomocysteine nucleosidase [candidate division Zixibacteria bacterium]
MPSSKNSSVVWPGTVLVLILISIIILVSGYAAEKPADKPFLILYAFSDEGRLIGESMSVTRTETHLGRTVTVGQLSGKDIVLAELGIGMTNAAMTVQRMVDEFDPAAVLVTGIAGSVDTSVNIGDIVVCSTWIEHDYGYIGANGFEPGPILVSLPGSDSLLRVLSFDVDSGLFAAARRLGEAELAIGKVGDRSPRLIAGGVGVSGNCFIDNKEKRLWLNEQFAALITDMESSAVAQVCAINSVPFVAFRSASDLAGGSGSATAGAELDEFLMIAADNSSSVVVRYLGELE